MSTITADNPRVSSFTTEEMAACRPAARDLQRATRRLRGKAAFIGALGLTSYVGLLLTHTLVLAIPFAVIMVLAVIATGTCVMHDANHGAFSDSKVINRIVGYSSDIMGASSWVWRQKHNGLHHANTNVVGLDTDIEQMPFARLAPGQPWRVWHRYQHIYMWGLYGFLTVQWALFSDLANVITRKIGSQPLRRRPKFWDLTMLLTGKALHASWSLVLPMFFHRWWVVVTFYLACSWTVGFALAVFFQVAHCVDSTSFAVPETPRRGDDFALHQLRTTANVQCGTPVIGPITAWLMGGLHQQIEHHLLPGVCHIHYPALAPLVQECAREHGLPYLVSGSFFQALAAHVRTLYRLGRPQRAALRPRPVLVAA